MSKKGTLYIIPVLLGGNDVNALIPQGTIDIIRSLKYFIVENEKSARQFLKLVEIPFPQSELIIFEIDKHNPDASYTTMLHAAVEGNNMGLLSEAGVPAVADPGAIIVHEAHMLDIPVMPLTGPSSILLALMASGLNGQSFAFHGYLPIDRNERIIKLKTLEKDAQYKKQTQLFIETPYRNNHLLKDIIENLSPKTKLCIAANITLANQYIKTQKIQNWKQLPDLNKQPCVFLIL